MELGALALGGLIGLSLGMLGGGGSILTVPIFVYLFGYGAREAVVMSLVIVGVTSLFGAVGHWRVGHVDLRVAGVFGSVAMVGTYAGARLAVFLSETAQLTLFALVMLAAAFFMFRPQRQAAEDQSCTAADRRSVREMPLGLIAAEGIGVGILTGLVGVGGGFMIVPALVLLGRVPMKRAVGTSLVIIAMKSAAGFYGYLGQVPLDWAFIAIFTTVAVVGIVVGARLMRFVPQAALQRVFAIFLVLTGTWMLYENRALSRASALPIDSATSVATTLSMTSMEQE